MNIRAMVESRPPDTPIKVSSTSIFLILVRRADEAISKTSLTNISSSSLFGKYGNLSTSIFSSVKLLKELGLFSSRSKALV